MALSEVERQMCCISSAELIMVCVEARCSSATGGKKPNHHVISRFDALEVGA